MSEPRRLRIVSTPDAPAPAGHYSQAIVHGNTVYVSGQLPIDPKTGEKFRGSIEEQTRQALKNVAAILKAARSDISRTVRVTIYISDMSLWPGANAAYAEFFGDHRPALTVVPTRDLHFGCQVEIDAVADCD